VLTEGDIRAALPVLRKYVFKLTRRVVDAKDLIQDAFAHAWAERDCYHGGDARLALYFTVMKNVYVSDMRRISGKPPPINAYSLADDSSLIDTPAFLCLIVRDVERKCKAYRKACDGR
jgi:DNA-directed RNA polymerase specialized sigma24 family protein